MDTCLERGANYLHMVQLMPMCHHIVSCATEIQNDLPFWCQLTKVVLEKKTSNGCNVVVFTGQMFVPDKQC